MPTGGGSMNGLYASSPLAGVSEKVPRAASNVLFTGGLAESMVPLTATRISPMVPCLAPETRVLPKGATVSWHFLPSALIATRTVLLTRLPALICTGTEHPSGASCGTSKMMLSTPAKLGGAAAVEPVGQLPAHPHFHRNGKIAARRRSVVRRGDRPQAGAPEHRNLLRLEREGLQVERLISGGIVILCDAGSRSARRGKYTERRADYSCGGGGTHRSVV